MKRGAVKEIAKRHEKRGEIRRMCTLITRNTTIQKKHDVNMIKRKLNFKLKNMKKIKVSTDDLNTEHI